MRTRALIAAVLAPLLAALGAGPAAPTGPRAATPEAAASAAVGSPRTGEVEVAAPSIDARLFGTVHVDAALQRLGVSLSFTRPDAGTWGRVWLGVRDGDGGCTRDVVVQGRSTDITRWKVREAGGAPVTVVTDFSSPSSSRILRIQLDRPNLPAACAVAELWSGDASGPTEFVKAGDRDLTRAVSDESLTTGFPVRFRLPWGETTTFQIDVRSTLAAPSAVQGLSVGLAPHASQGPVVEADSDPVSWDFWADGPADLALPVMPTEPWGTRVRPSLTTDQGSWLRQARRVRIKHPPPTDWEGSLAGLRLWLPEDFLGVPDFPTMSFQDDTWVHLHRSGKVAPRCTTVSSHWRFGCQRYWYDADTGRLQIGQLQARVTDAGWWWQGDDWDRSFRVRELGAGETRHYRGRGMSLVCCPYPRAQLSLRKDGSYSLVRGRDDEHGHYRSLRDAQVRLDPGARGGRTRTVQLDFFGRMVDGEWRLRWVRLGNVLTRPR